MEQIKEIKMDFSTCQDQKVSLLKVTQSQKVFPLGSNLQKSAKSLSWALFINRKDVQESDVAPFFTVEPKRKSFWDYATFNYIEV